MTKCGILLIGHGSRLEYNKELVTATAELMREKRPESIIKPCFLEYTRPSVPEGLDAMRSEDIDVLIAVPLFLSKGVHVLQNIQSILGLEAGKKSGSFTLESGKEISLIYSEPIGANPLLAELMLQNADAAMAMPGVDSLQVSVEKNR